MAKSPRPSARKDAIRMLREAKGWGQQALSDRAVVSIKTLNSIEQGKPAQLSTFAKIAKALGVEPSAFLEGHQTNAPAADQAERRVEVKITLSIPFENFDETEGLDRLVGLFTSLMNAKNAVTITGLSPGSVQLTMLVDEEDVPRLMQAFAQGKLDAIQATEIMVNEACLRLAGAANVEQWKSRADFLIAAAVTIRRMLVENALRKQSLKRDGGFLRRQLNEDVPPSLPETPEDLLALDEALQKLAGANPQAAELVQLVYFAGITLQEAARTLDVSPRTAERLWAYARAWLRREIDGDSSASEDS